MKTAAIIIALVIFLAVLIVGFFFYQMFKDQRGTPRTISTGAHLVVIETEILHTSSLTSGHKTRKGAEYELFLNDTKIKDRTIKDLIGAKRSQDYKDFKITKIFNISPDQIAIEFSYGEKKWSTAVITVDESKKNLVVLN